MDRKTQVLHLVRERGALTTLQVCAELLLDRANTSAYLNALVEAGHLKKAQVGRYVYYSTDGTVPGDATDSRPDSRRKEILEFVRSSGPVTTNRIASELVLDRANTSAHLNDLVKRGEVQKARLGRDVYYSCDRSLPEPDHLRGAIEENLHSSNALGARRCPRCGTEADAEFLYCPKCGSGLSKNRSRIILSEVKQAVWVRDGGKCVLCGSRSNLHYDHVIPVAKGGGNTVENIQVLCADCNLKKSDRIQ